MNPPTLPVIAAMVMLASAAAGELPTPPALSRAEGLPEGDTGIASKYPGDAGIRADPAVVFCSDFENLESDTLRKAWENPWGHATIEEQPEIVCHGRKSLKLMLKRTDPDKPEGAGVWQMFKEGFDTLHLRYYEKFDKDWNLNHFHDGASIEGLAPETTRYGSAGHAANGKDKFEATLDTFRFDEVPSPGRMAIYCYHPEQRHSFGEHFYPSGVLSPKGIEPALAKTARTGSTGADFFGKQFVPRPEFVPERGRWYCFEIMVKINTVGQRDGRIAFWIDGKLSGDFPGMRLRDVESLKINRIRIHHYTRTDRSSAIMWYDDVVAATSYIGPMAKEKRASLPPPAQKSAAAAAPPASPSAPQQAALSPEALAPWHAKLIGRVIAGVKDGQSPTAHLKVMGTREEPVKVAGADDKSLYVELQGNRLPVAWPRVSPGDRLNLARAFLKEDRCDDHILVAVLALAAGREELAGEHFARAPGADSKEGAAKVTAARSSLGLK